VDGSGTIAAVGKDVRGFKVGDPVYSYSWDNPTGGFYAEYVTVPAKYVGHVPPGLSLRDAGTIAVTALTAIQGIDDALHLQPGQTLIIHGASGAVGTLAVQFAKLRGARVLATASGEDGMALVRRLGADAVVDGHHGDLPAAIRAFAPNGVDAVLGLAGGEPLSQCATALRRGGRLAYPNGVYPVPKATDGFSVVGYDAVAGASEFERLNAAIEQAHLTVPIAAEFPLADASKAHELLAAGHVLGRIVLRVR
jgi:NADPH:quinone reductase-like Zn-dependent oxidoreductase